jgi:tetratricopeptide (TPR) repeat protein
MNPVNGQTRSGRDDGSRPLAEIYGELAAALLRIGDELRAGGETTRAETRFAEAAQAFGNAIREGGSLERFGLGLAHAQERLGRHQDALRTYLDMVRSQPTTAPAILPIAHRCLTPRLARELGRWIDTEWRPAVLRVDIPGRANAAIREFLGRVALYRGDYSAAVEDYRAVSVDRPDDLFVLEGLGEALWRAGEAAAAISILQTALRRADGATEPERAARVRLKLGNACIDGGSPHTAIGPLREGLALGGRWHSEFWTALARARLALGRWDGAIRAAERAVEGGERVASPHAVRAAALLERREYQQAVSAAEAALTIDPRDPVALRAEGRALIDGRIDIDQGIRLTSQYLEQTPTDTSSRLFLARVMRSAGRPPRDVVAVLAAGIGRSGGDEPADLYFELAEAYKDADDPTSAIRILDQADVGCDRIDRCRWWRLRGDVLRVAGDLKGALDAYSKSLTLDPSGTGTAQSIASILTEEKQFAAAVQTLQRAVAANPRDGGLRLELALAARCAGDELRAWEAVRAAIVTGVYGKNRTDAYVIEAELAEALQRPPGEIVAAHYEAGRHLYWDQDYVRAIDFLNRATQLDPEHPGARWFQVDATLQKAWMPAWPYIDDNGLKDARELWTAALRLGRPTRDQAWAYIAGALIAEKLGDRCPTPESAPLKWEAVALVERSLVLNETNLFAWTTLTRLHRAIRNDGTALAASEKAMALNAEDLSAIGERIAILVNRGDAARARPLLDRLRERSPSTWADGVNAFMLYFESLEETDIRQATIKLQGAVDAIGSVIAAEPEDLWNLLFRASRLRRLAFRDPAGAETYRERARTDYRTVWSHRDDSAYFGEEGSFADAAYGLGKVALALDILKPMLGDPTDPSGVIYRDCGCCYLRLGEFDQAEVCLKQGVAQAVSPLELEGLELQLAEIKEDAADAANRRQILELLGRIRASIDEARNRVAEPPSAKAELQRYIDWDEAVRSTDGWSRIAAQAGMARLCVESGALRDAEVIYRALRQEADRFPEADAGLVKVAARCRQLGEEALKQGWEQPGAWQKAIEYFEHALALVETIPEPHRGGLLARLALAQFQAGMAKQAAETLAAAAETLTAQGQSEVGALIGDIWRRLVSDASQFWVADGYLRVMMQQAGTPKPLAAVLPQMLRRLGDYLENVRGLAEDWWSRKPPVIAPLAVATAKNLEVGQGEEKEWPLLAEMRDRIEDETGVSVPPVPASSGELGLPDRAYVILLDDVPIASGTIPAAARYCPSPAGALRAAAVPLDELQQAKHPMTMQPGWWVPEKYWERVQRARGCTLWPDPIQFAVAHLEAVARSNLAAFVGVQEASNLLEGWSRLEKNRRLIQDFLPDPPKRDRFLRVLRALLREGVPITNGEDILKAVGEVGLSSDDVGHAVGSVRLRIRNDLPGNQPGVDHIDVPPEIENAILQRLTVVGDRKFLTVPPEEVQDLLAGIRMLVREDNPGVALVIEREEPRAPLRRLIEPEFPHLSVQWRAETVGAELRRDRLGTIPVLAEWSGPADPGSRVARAD